MKLKIFTWLFLSSLVLMATPLALYWLNINHYINLPPQASILLRSYSEFVSSIILSPTERTEVPKKKIIVNYSEREPTTTHPDFTERKQCTSKTLGKVITKAPTKIYTWVDEHGVTHFSDRDSEQNKSAVIEVQGDLRPEYFQLKLETIGLHSTFKKELSARIYKSFLFYKKHLSKANLEKIAVNMKVFSSKKDYLDYQRKTGSNISPDKNGYYSHRNNESVLLFQSESYTTKVAVHEAAHSITAGLIGRTNTWLTEGISEYLESLKVHQNSALIAPNSSWYKNKVWKFEPIPLKTLFDADHSLFHGAKENDFYATSWAFIHYLSESSARQKQLSRLLTLELEDPCTANANSTLVVLATGQNISTLQRNFTKWLSGQSPHVHAY